MRMPSVVGGGSAGTQQVASMGLRCGAGGAEHAHNLRDSGAPCHLCECRDAASVDNLLGNEEVVRSEGRNLGEVSDGDDLVIAAEFEHLHTYSSGNLSSHVGINLIKNEQGSIILLG